MNRAEFNQCLQMLCSDDKCTYEDGYDWMLDYLEQNLDKLINLMRREKNPEMRSRFIELIGESKNPKVITCLKEELLHEDCEVRSWAYATLLYLEDPQAHKIARQYKDQNPNEKFLR